MQVQNGIFVFLGIRDPLADALFAPVSLFQDLGDVDEVGPLDGGPGFAR